MWRGLDRRIVPPLLVGAAVAVAAVVVVASATAAARPTVKVVTTAGLGKLLTTASGLTLYHYTDEKHGKIDCKGACAKLWPPLLVKAGTRPTLGPGLSKAKVGTVVRPDGRTQVTYNGLALYRYAPDRKVGDVRGQGLAKAWYVIAPNGKIVRREVETETEPGTSGSDTTPTDTSPAGGGYDYG
jgi:predicted lipoprotein with Yx(FWY)xxD motif